VLRVRLREAIALAEKRTGERVTYDFLARSTGLSRATIEALASRPGYNPRLSTIERLCEVLEINPGDLLEWTVESRSEPGEDV
jgi:DNA-binding Xre family transcriptional regulator